MLRQDPGNAVIARTMGLAIILISNILLVQVNSSNIDFAFRTFSHLIKDKFMWMVNIGTVAGLAVLLYSPLNAFIKLAPLSFGQLIAVVGISIIAVLWYEVIKFLKLIKDRV